VAFDFDAPVLFDALTLSECINLLFLVPAESIT